MLPFLHLVIETAKPFGVRNSHYLLDEESVASEAKGSAILVPPEVSIQEKNWL